MKPHGSTINKSTNCSSFGNSKQSEDSHNFLVQDAATSSSQAEKLGFVPRYPGSTTGHIDVTLASRRGEISSQSVNSFEAQNVSKTNSGSFSYPPFPIRGESESIATDPTPSKTQNSNARSQRTIYDPPSTTDILNYEELVRGNSGNAKMGDGNIIIDNSRNRVKGPTEQFQTHARILVQRDQAEASARSFLQSKQQNSCPPQLVTTTPSPLEPSWSVPNPLASFSVQSDSYNKAKIDQSASKRSLQSSLASSTPSTFFDHSNHPNDSNKTDAMLGSKGLNPYVNPQHPRNSNVFVEKPKHFGNQHNAALILQQSSTTSEMHRQMSPLMAPLMKPPSSLSGTSKKSDAQNQHQYSNTTILPHHESHSSQNRRFQNGQSLQLSKLAAKTELSMLSSNNFKNISTTKSQLTMRIHNNHQSKLKEKSQLSYNEIKPCAISKVYNSSRADERNYEQKQQCSNNVASQRYLERQTPNPLSPRVNIMFPTNTKSADFSRQPGQVDTNKPEMTDWQFRTVGQKQTGRMGKRQINLEKFTEIKSSSSGPPRRVLTQEARSALMTAVLSSLRSPDGKIDKQALHNAMATGLPKQAVEATAVAHAQKLSLNKKSSLLKKDGFFVQQAQVSHESFLSSAKNVPQKQQKVTKRQQGIISENGNVNKACSTQQETMPMTQDGFGKSLNLASKRDTPDNGTMRSSLVHTKIKENHQGKNVVSTSSPLEPFGDTPLDISSIFDQNKVNEKFNYNFSNDPYSSDLDTRAQSTSSSHSNVINNGNNPQSLSNEMNGNVPNPLGSSGINQLSSTSEMTGSLGHQNINVAPVRDFFISSGNDLSAMQGSAAHHPVQPNFSSSSKLSSIQSSPLTSKLLPSHDVALIMQTVPRNPNLVPSSSLLSKVTSTEKQSTMKQPQKPITKKLTQVIGTRLTGLFRQWERINCGLFILDSVGKYVESPRVNHSFVKSTNKISAAESQMRYRSSIYDSVSTTKTVQRQAELVQKVLKQRNHITESDSRPTKMWSASCAFSKLCHPDQFKRFKIQPKKESKSLEKALKKSRSTTCRTLVKKHKMFLKRLLVHQSEFLRYHRLHRLELSRLARSVRDQVDKSARRKERDVEAERRNRIAALKANDIEAYTSLLEETKNERLKFLLGKTDEYIAQISDLLKKERGEGGKVGTAPASSKGSYYASAHVKSEEICQPSILIGGTLKEYQLAGVQWMVSLYNNKLNGILADEMGLGKTIQTISLLAYLMEFKENRGPFLVIVPLSTLSNWVNEFIKWCPAALVITYKGTPQQRKELFKEEVSNGHFNVLLTTYEYIIKDKSSLKKIAWQYAIVDEGHRMKNAQSKFAVILGTQYMSRHRLLLTGTPLQNNLPELWALLNFLLPTIFESAETFDQWFNRPFAQFGNVSSTASDDVADEILTNEERMLIIHRLHELLRPFMLRRVKSEVLDQLPEKIEKVIRCELSSWQKCLYQQISINASKDSKLIDNQGSSTAPNTTVRGMNNIVMQLRKVCNHPYLFSEEGYCRDEDIIRSSGKIELLDRMLPKLKAGGHRVLIFTQMTAVMTILEDYFCFRGFSSLRLDGSTPAEDREKRMYKFNAPDSPYFIFLLSTRAGGLGLNLASADTVIIFDSDWNPMMDLQAQDRAHRIGQRNTVRVFRLITYSPVEEKILSRATEKLNMSEIVVEAGKFDKRSVEEDNSQERRKLMEILLTDFDTPNLSKSSNTSNAPSESNEDDDVESIEVDMLNEMLSNNDTEYDLYCKMDDARLKQQKEPSSVCCALYTDPNDVPHWIKFPKGQKGKNEESASVMYESDLGDQHASKRRKTKTITYDDGLTEHQFVKMVEKNAKDVEEGMKSRKRSKSFNENQERAKKKDSATTQSDEGREKSIKSRRKNSSSSTNEKNGNAVQNMKCNSYELLKQNMINACKMVIAMKEASSKRKIAEIFLEKPCPKTYPDYYQIVENPIGIHDILKGAKRDKYTTLDRFWADWQLLFRNAKKYNADGSWVVNDAGSIENALKKYLLNHGLDADYRKQVEQSQEKKKRTKKVEKKGKSLNVNDTRTGPDRLSSESDEDNDSTENEYSLYSDVVGMDERVVDSKKRGRIRSGGRGSRTKIGIGSRGGKGAYNKKRK